MFWWIHPSISLAITGGCTRILLFGQTPQKLGTSCTNLAAGTYGVTVTDKSNPAKVASIDRCTGNLLLHWPSIALRLLSAHLVAMVPSISHPGVPNLIIYQWSGGSSATTQDISGLAPGAYTVQVTDANGLQRPREAIQCTTKSILAQTLLYRQR